MFMFRTPSFPLPLKNKAGCEPSSYFHLDMQFDFLNEVGRDPSS
jgi:hypothetical protein